MSKTIPALHAILAISLGVPVTNTSYAQTGGKIQVPETKTSPSAEAIESAMRLLKATGQVQQMREEMHSALKFQTAVKEGADQEMLKEMEAVMSKEENIAKLHQIMAEAIASHFSIEDLNQLADFFESPLGKRYTGNQTVIATEAAEAARTWGRMLGEQATERPKSK